MLKRSDDNIKRITLRHIKWTLPSLEKLSVKELEQDRTPIKRITDAIDTQDKMSVLNKVICELKQIFDIAITERVINSNPAYNLQKDYQTPLEYAKSSGKIPHYAALIDESHIKEFIKDLK